MNPSVPLRLLFIVLAALGLAGVAIAGHQEPAGDTAVKADFLPKFPRYVEWPAEARPAEGAPYQLCVVGTDPFGDRLDRAAASELIGRHAVTVRRIAEGAEAEGCHIAYVHGATAEDTDRLLAAIGPRAILTVTDTGAGTQRGMIHFARQSGRIRFFIDDAAAAARGLTISSRLLALAIGVRQRRL